MKFVPLLKTCIKALVRNPMRALLTILGIVIGIASVISLMEIGRGSTEQIKSTIASMGASTINVFPGSANTSGIRTGSGGRASLTPADAEAIARECPSIVRTSPVMRTSGQVIYGNVNWSPESIEGGNVDYLRIREWYEMEEGEPYSEEDVIYARRVCLVGQTVAKEIFGVTSPIGKEIRIKNVVFKVIGILKKKGANMMGRDQDDVIVIPWTSIKFRLQGYGGGSASSSSPKYTYNRANIFPSASVAYYPSNRDTPYTNAPHPRRFNNIEHIMVQISDPEKSRESIEEVAVVLRQRHRLPDDADDDFRVWDMAEMTQVISSTSQSMTQLLLIVAMISLVVGGVGIMNIMMVSVTERTREIGLRMSVGAKSGDVLRQFLLESILLCLIGGAVGIGLGRIISIIVGKSLGWPTMLVPEAMALAVGVSAAIGIVFGWYPAWKASRMDPIDALRHE